MKNVRHTHTRSNLNVIHVIKAKLRPHERCLYYNIHDVIVTCLFLAVLLKKSLGDVHPNHKIDQDEPPHLEWIK